MSEHNITAQFATLPDFGIDKNGNCYARFTAREFRRRVGTEKQFNFWFSVMFDRPESNMLQAAELVSRVQNAVLAAYAQRVAAESVEAYDAALAMTDNHDTARAAADEVENRTVEFTEQDLIEGVFAFHDCQWRMWGELGTDIPPGMDKQVTQFTVRGIAESLEFTFANRLRDNGFRPSLQAHVMKRALESVANAMTIQLPQALQTTPAVPATPEQVAALATA